MNRLILWKEFIELNTNMDMIIENEKHVELNANVVNVVLDAQSLKMIDYYTNVYAMTRMTKKIICIYFVNAISVVFFLKLQRVVYPNDYMDDCNEFSK